MSSEELPGSFQQKDDENYQRNRRISPNPTHHLKSHSKVTTGSNRLTNRLDASKHKGIQPQKDSPPSPTAPGHTNVQRTVKYTMQSLAYLIDKQEKQNAKVNERFNEMFKAIAAIPNVTDL